MLGYKLSTMKNFYGFAIAGQLVLLLSVYIIYFQCTLQTDLQPPRTFLNQPPAERLVVFVVDGLSAKSFFEKGCHNVPHLREIFLRQGQVGISLTRMTNNTRSTYVTLVSGRYEDYFAGIHRTQVDTIFNRSNLSVAWCQPELQNLFKSNYKLSFAEDDEAVFMEVQSFILHEGSKLKQRSGLVFFVQLLALSTCKNAYITCQDQLNRTQYGIWTTYRLFEQVFPDQRTAYLLTSNQRGPVKAYSRAKYHKDEVENPFIVWGAGVDKNSNQPGRKFVANEQGQLLPLQVLDFTQLATLMSSLLGLPAPVHNMGKLPMGVLNGTKYEAHALYMNALQLVRQAKQALDQHQRGLLSSYLPSHWLDGDQIQKFISAANLLWHQQRFVTLSEFCANFFGVLIFCTDYYVNYYRKALLIASSCAFLGWIRQLSGSTKGSSSLQVLVFEMLFRLIFLSLLMFLLLQRVPWLTSGLLLLAPIFWTCKVIPDQEQNIPYWQLMLLMLFSICCFVGFFFRRLFGLCYFGFCCFHNRKVLGQCSLKGITWFLLVCTLTFMPWLEPSLGCWHRNWLLFSFFITSLRPLLCNPQLLSSYSHKTCFFFNGLVLLIAGLHVLLSSQAQYLQLIARAYACYALIPRFILRDSKQFIYNLLTLYALLSTSWEAIIIQLLTLELQLALRIKQEEGIEIKRKHTIAMYMVLYSLLSLFLIGNFDGLDRFVSCMCFEGFGLYSTLINSLLIALKLLLPILMLMSIICANCHRMWIRRQEIFTVLLIMCNFMALVALSRLHAGIVGWESFIHFIQLCVMQILPIIILLIYYAAHYWIGDPDPEISELPKWSVHNY